MPKFIHDIIPPRVRKHLSRRIASLFAPIPEPPDPHYLTFRAKRAAAFFIFTLWRGFGFLFRSRAFVIASILLVIGITAFRDSLFTRATISRFAATQCEGTFTNPSRAQGTPDVPIDGAVHDFNEENSAVFTEGSKHVDCDGFARPDETFSKARLTFVLGIRKKGGSPVPLPTSGFITSSPSPSASHEITPTPDASQEIAPTPTETINEESSTPLPTTPNEGEGEEITSPVIPVETGIQEDGSRVKPGMTDETEPTVEIASPTIEAGARNDDAQVTPESSPVSRLQSFLAKLLYPQFAEAQEENTTTPSDSISPSPSDTIAPSPSDSVIPAPRPSEAESEGGEAGIQNSPMDPGSGSGMTEEEPGMTEDAEVTPEPTGEIASPSVEARNDTQNTPEPTPSDTIMPSPSDAFILPNIDAGLDQQPVTSNQQPVTSDQLSESFDFVDFVAKLRYSVGSGEWKTLEEVTKVPETGDRRPITSDQQSAAENILKTPEISQEIQNDVKFDNNTENNSNIIENGQRVGGSVEIPEIASPTI
ncbi:MAG: hypothetical protein Q8Q39_02265, partial [bacterium]|nr:hypothetical protein [bacterium]